MKEKKNIILLIIAIILFLVALIFLVWSTKQKNIDNTNINNTNEILNVLYAPLLSPLATFADINFEIAFGTPIDVIARAIA